LTYLLVALGVAARSARATSLSFLVLGLWHPQQGVFVAGSYLVAWGALDGAREMKQRAGSILAGLALALLGLLIFRAWLGFDYQGRLGYLRASIGPDVLHWLAGAIWFAFWLLVIQVLGPPLRSTAWPAAWMVGISMVAALTADVSRVASIIGLPMLLVPLQRRISASPAPGVPLWLVAANLAIPIHSWSGTDFLLWSDLIGDLCRYGVLCIR
jgi:hypothetical protein